VLAAQGPTPHLFRGQTAPNQPRTVLPKNALTWTCSACGETVLNLPMTVLKHQLSHVERRPLATAAVPKPEPEHEQNGDGPER
jgi:hypothetical protein